MALIDVGVLFKQGDPGHSKVILGNGPRTIGQSGCLLSCFVYCARALVGPKGLTILEANERLTRERRFVGSGLIRNKAAASLGLELGNAAGAEPFRLGDIPFELECGRPVILGIDYKASRSSGLSDADHFVVAVGYDGDRVSIVDPAVGRVLEVLPTVFPYGMNKHARFAEMCIVRKA